MKTIAELLVDIPKTDANPHRAVIFVHGHPRHGRVAHRELTSGGIFWPDDGEILTEPIQEAVLEIQGGKAPVPISNVEQCSASRHHWNFDLPAEGPPSGTIS
jgi:hypothetical protein